MNTTRTTRTIRFAWMLLAALVLGVLTAREAGASPNQPHKSISQRVAIQTGNCKDGGGTIEVTNTYGSRTNGRPLISSTTTCTGGVLGGTTCTNTKTETNCSQTMTQPPVTGGTVWDVGSPVVGAPVEPVGGGAIVVSGFGMIGENVASEPARSDGGSPDGTVAETGTKPAIILIEAAPAAGHLEEEDQEP